ncbi:MAG: hypothetical protein ACOCXZ_04250 [Chloroflexota bacterium]
MTQNTSAAGIRHRSRSDRRAHLLVHRVLQQNESVYFPSTQSLCEFLACNDRTEFHAIMRELRRYYGIIAYYDDYGITVVDGSRQSHAN